MGTGSSSYRPKAIYLDIDGRIQKVAPSPSFPARRGRPAGAPPAVPARRRPLPGDSAGSRRRVGPARGRRRGRGRRSSEPASVEPAAALDNSGRGLVGLCGAGVPTRGPVERRDCRGDFFHFVGRAFFVTDLMRLSSSVQRLVRYKPFTSGGTLTPGAGGQTCRAESSDREGAWSSQPLWGPGTACRPAGSRLGGGVSVEAGSAGTAHPPPPSVTHPSRWPALTARG